ncbi:hypothetical protein PMAYCL1PPCAC_11717, partial [Pristionchus mayeri]
RKKKTAIVAKDEGADADDDGTQVDQSAKRKKKSTQGSNGRKKRQNTTLNENAYKNAFKEFVANSCKMGIQGLLAEFDDIKKQTQAIGATPKIAFDAHPDKNRYKDVFCVDGSRVVLNGGAHDYIHANWVETHDKPQYICTQGPITATIDDFWRMVWQEKCKSIVMLCNIMECGKKKCEQYWPEAAGQEIKYGELTVKATAKGEFEKLMTVTNLTMTDGSDSHEVEHIIWNNWPDRGVPSDVLTCFKLLEKLKKLSPTVIHCSAGIGRTGTIVGLDLIISRLKAGEVKTAKEIVIELRSKRHGSVQMDIQYLYMHRVLIALGLSRKVVKESEVKAFIDAYEALCKQRGFL